MSDSSSVQLFFVEETAWGEIPVSGGSPEAPNLNEFRFTNDSLTQTTETSVSEEIRSDRQVSDIIRTAVSAGGEVGVELSFGSHDALLAGGLYDNFSAEVNEVSVSASFTLGSPGPGVFQLLASPVQPSPNWLANVSVGQFLRITGSLTSPTNDGFYKVAFVDAAAGLIRFTTAPPSSEPAGTFNIRGSFIKNGVTRKSFTIEKEFSDVVVTTDSPHTGAFQYFTGMRVGTVSLTIAPGSIINGSFTFEGKQAFSVGATIGDGLPTEVSTADVLNAVDNITDILINGVEDPNCSFTSVEFSIENNLRAQPCIGSLANSGIGLGRTNVTGTIEAYLLDRTFFERYLNFDTVSISFRATLGGDSYLFDFPAVKFISGTTETPGNDADVLVSVEFNAKRDPTSDYMVAINKFPAGTV
ncbi:MAG: phage tail tube protein [Gammaproteobacteria bacterium]|nr:phage tail tube protein [Gammaproteobacteria bacterium]